MTALGVDTAESKSWLVRNGYSTADALAAVVAVLLAVAYATSFVLPSWTPRMAILLMTLPYTTVLLGRQALRREPLALAAWGFICAATISSAFSGTFRLSVLGVVGSETGVLMFLASLGLMAIGTELSERGQRALVWAVIVGVGLSGAAGLLQIIVQADSGSFSLAGGRATGLTPWPVYFGVCAAGAFGVIVGRVSTNRRTIPVDVALAIWFGMSIGLSGTRVAFGGAVVVGLIAIAMHRGLRPVLSTGGLVIGILLGRAIAAQFNPTVGVADRANFSGFGRTEMWRYAFASFLDRPLLGFGPGGFREAIQDDVTASFAARFGRNIETTWFNAHNYFFHSAATLGVLGLLAIGVLAVLFVRRARGPLAYGGLALVLSSTLQPFSLSTMPLALLLLGGACAVLPPVEHDEHQNQTDDDEAKPTFVSGGASPYLLLPGVLLGCFLLTFDWSLQQAISDQDADAAATWVQRMPPDPFLADRVAEIYLLSSNGDLEAAASAIEWGERAIDEQPNLSMWYIRQGARLARLGDIEAALDAMTSARVLEPNSRDAIEGQFVFLVLLDREEEADALRPLVCELGISGCGTIPEVSTTDQTTEVEE
jgi:O-antigen ligase